MLFLFFKDIQNLIYGFKGFLEGFWMSLVFFWGFLHFSYWFSTGRTPYGSPETFKIEHPELRSLVVFKCLLFFFTAFGVALRFFCDFFEWRMLDSILYGCFVIFA